MWPKFKTGNLILCDFHETPLYIRQNGSMCYLYDTLNDMKRRRNRVYIAPNKSIIKILNTKEYELDDCSEESEYYSSQSEGDRPTGLTYSEEEQMIEFFKELEKKTGPILS